MKSKIRTLLFSTLAALTVFAIVSVTTPVALAQSATTPVKPARVVYNVEQVVAVLLDEPIRRDQETARADRRILDELTRLRLHQTHHAINHWRALNKAGDSASLLCCA